MTTRYRMVGWLGLLGLVGGTLSASAQAPTREDSIKGKIWSATAQQVWAVAPKMPAAQLKPWSTSQDFNTWLKSKANAELAKQSELGMLQSKVVDRVKAQNQGSPNATAGQVAAAILAEIGQQQDAKLKMGRLARLDLAALTTNLTPYVPAAAPVANPVATPAAAVPTSPPGTKPDASQSVVDENPAPDTPAALSSEPNYPPAAVTVSNATYFGLSPYAAMAVVGLLGAALGAFLFAQFGSRRSARHSHRPPAPTFTSDIPVKDTPEYKKLRQAYDKLQREVNELKRQIAELRGQSAPMAPPPAEPEPDDLFEVTPQDVAPYEAAPPAPVPAERPAATPSALTLYGPVQETPFLEERKIVDSPLPQLALMLTIDPRKPEQASFTLNPQVNQVMLIGDGLNRLQKFFDYDMPMGRISSVTAAAPGKLQRQADGWQVVERARLTIR